MRAIFLTLLAIYVVAGPALAQDSVQKAAQDATGEWRVADDKALIRVVDCGGALWGVVSWERKPGRDVNNPNPALRRRPTLGMPILLHMRATDEPGRWEGQIYNAHDGQTYDGSIALRSANTLHVEGCALGIFCGGEDWTRMRNAGPRVAGRETGTTGENTPAAAPAAEICSTVAAVPGRTH